MRQDYNRIDPKRRIVVDHRKKQFATPQFKDAEYPNRLNFYTDAPTADITLEQFEQWAIDRLKGEELCRFIRLTALMACSVGGTGSMLVSQPLASRDHHTHEGDPRQTPTPRRK